jgi:hypothetical protein
LFAKINFHLAKFTVMQGPLFEGAHIAARLDETDADFVDVIHSNGENLILGGLGSWQPLGHVDFYPSMIFKNLTFALCYFYISFMSN